MRPAASPPVSLDTAALAEIQRRVLWLASNIVHHANRVRPNPSGIKVGGHQASSASVVTILTELFFDFMRPGDKLSVKPHASPVLHAIHYLLGNLDRSYLTRLRDFHGLQAYPSRTKDPDPIDFSTGSVGLGSVAPNFAALVERYVRSHFGSSSDPSGRFISLIGDAELDEGSVWEAIAEPVLAGLGNLIWIVDLNRQSLDRIVPGIRVRQLEAMFAANGWTVIEAKYGRQLKTAFGSPGGEKLRTAIDEMSNEQYQLLLRSSPQETKRVLGDATPNVPDTELIPLISDLGGHDFEVLAEALANADSAAGPAVIFAYTIKGWGLPIAADPLNHSALMSEENMAQLRHSLEVPPEDEWATLPVDTRGRTLVDLRARELKRQQRSKVAPPLEVPDDLGVSYRGSLSTQRALGQILMAVVRESPTLAKRLVTSSPDVGTSTNLGGWINKVAVWSSTNQPDPFTVLGPRLIQWNQRPAGQHIELGISETNLLMLLGQLGLAGEVFGEQLFPIGTLYDPFVARALDAFIYGVYSGSRFVLVGTPSGVTLAPEGGAHQSVATPALGVALPGVTYWEPCFAKELEWILLEAMKDMQRADTGRSWYLRLSTAPVDQSLLLVDGQHFDVRSGVLSGAYCLLDRSGDDAARSDNSVEIWSTGVMVPHALRASEELLADGIYASVINCVSPGEVYRKWQLGVHSSLATLRPSNARDSDRPVITVIDGHPSSLAWVGSMLGTRAYPLGVTGFGQSGTPAELYHEFRIDSEAICMAAFAALAGGLSGYR